MEGDSDSHLRESWNVPGEEMKSVWDKCGQDGVFISTLSGSSRWGVRLGSGMSEESRHLGECDHRPQRAGRMQYR